MTWRKASDAFGTTFLLCLRCLVNPALAGDDRRVEVKIDKRVTVVPPGTLSRAMMSMVRHPDGAIFLNTQIGPLYKSTDEGQTWTPLPVKITNFPPKQTLHGLGVNRKGRLLLVH